MEGYDLISVADDKKLGKVVRAEGDYVIFEHGTLRKQHHAIPKTTLEVLDDRGEVRTTLARALIEDSPKIGDEGLDREELARYYGLADTSAAPPTEGYGETVPTDPVHGPETEEQAAGVEPAVEQRARIREGGTSGDRPGGIPQESPAMLGERYSSADVPEEER
jgi:hypothetical protein